MLIGMKTVKITEKGQIALPKEMREKRGFEEGSKIVILTYDDRMEIRSMEKINEKMESAFATEKVLARDWNTEEEDNAWRNL
ncbi:AbrB/MazE/SpoVT family DNA-binding domain-containing protein [Candidatus Woesearchaeota archaeon]|nr:AbrB/MazE/SpoVT family DNA-binding domain-containing protein [Candidatus Woesearchaeota archaeon]